MNDEADAMSGASDAVNDEADAMSGASDAVNDEADAANGTSDAAFAALVLAAGAGTRFGGGKMQARLAGRLLPAHAVAAARGAGITRVVIVLGRDAAVIRPAMAQGEPLLVVLNPAPERGLASSLRIGVRAATASPAPAGVLILLGDQPFVRVEVIRALLAAAATAPEGTLAVVPRYGGDAAPNPVLLLRAGFSLVHEAAGDRGLGRLLADAGDRVVAVSVAGANPDIDTPADLAAHAPGGAR